MSHSSKWLDISPGGTKRFRYSGWVYSNGPQAQIYLFMKRAGESGYYSYLDWIDINETGRWVYVERELEVAGDVTRLNLRIDNNGGGSVWFDDLRLHPANALMTTYTHRPMVGLTSKTDARGVTTYYEYDDFQWLKAIKDHAGNILKSFDYHYKP